MTMAKKKDDREFEAWAQKWKLDDEEREILASIERGEWKPVANQKKEITRHRGYARYTLENMRKSQSISVRVNPRDLEAFKARAADEGLPYQTLISSYIHKYGHGKKVA